MWGVLVTSVVGGCGARPAEEPAARATPQPSTTSVELNRLQLTAADLPSGWRDSNSQGIDYRTTVCGVDLEPSRPERARSLRFSKSAVGPFLEQHIRTYDRDRTSAVITALQQALPSCSRFEAKGTNPQSPTAVFTVEPLEVPGLAATDVAWRQTVQGELPITSDILITRRGTTAITLMSYVLRGSPDPDVLARAYRALPKD